MSTFEIRYKINSKCVGLLNLTKKKRRLGFRSIFQRVFRFNLRPVLFLYHCLSLF